MTLEEKIAVLEAAAAGRGIIQRLKCTGGKTQLRLTHPAVHAYDFNSNDYEIVPVTKEDAAIEFAVTHAPIGSLATLRLLRSGFIAGAEWQKEAHK